jgi:hypothetical protein
MPTRRTVDNIKSALLKPALTSHYEVKIPIPPGLSKNPKYLESNGLRQFVNLNQDSLNLMCAETSLPGSNIGTMDITGDYHGVTQRHANRRIYDDRIDMTFYVDASNYLPIRYFEVWMKYVVGESIAESNGRPGSQSPQYFYRLNYPKEYIAEQGLEITKFERTYTNSLTYKFINAFPISIASMPVSYDSSSLLKCTVSFSYIRYVLDPTSSGEESGEPKPEDAKSGSSSSASGDPSSPINQAAINGLQFNPNVFNQSLGLNYGNFTTTGGVNYSAASSSGNAIDTQTAFNSGASLF